MLRLHNNKGWESIMILKINVTPMMVTPDVLQLLLREAFDAAGAPNAQIDSRYNFGTHECDVSVPDGFDKSVFAQSLANAAHNRKADHAVDRNAQVITYRAPDLSINQSINI